MTEQIFDHDRRAELKRMLHRIVSMLTRLIACGDSVSEPVADFNAEVEYKHEYRVAEYEYDRDLTDHSVVMSSSVSDNCFTGLKSIFDFF